MAVLLFYHFSKAQYLLLKSSNKLRIFSVTIFCHLFIQEKYLTFPISNKNKSDDKKVTDYRNVYNPAYFLNMSLNIIFFSWHKMIKISQTFPFMLQNYLICVL